MSVGAVCKTNLNNQESLVSALSEIFGKDKVQVHAHGVNVRGYGSSRRPTITLDLPRMYGTAGFVKGADGNFELVYDSTDASRLEKVLPKKKGDITHNYLAQIHTRIKAMESIKSVKGKLVKNQVEEDGSIRLRLKVSSYGDE
jgi:hypothetical protein